MATREDSLETYTFKNQCPDDHYRIFYTLTRDVEHDRPTDDQKKRNDEMTLHRIAKCVTELTLHLLQSGVLSQDQLDDLLLSVRSR